MSTVEVEEGARKGKGRKGKGKEVVRDDLPPPPPPLSVPLRPSHPPGFAIQRSLFYNSTTWHQLVHADVDALLAAFATAYTRAPTTASPFGAFKRLWIDLGWTQVHLLGTPDGPMRRPWAESVFRAFLEHIHSGEDALKQAGALFAVYTFWATQAKSQERIHIEVDPPTLDYIRTLPITLSSTFPPHPTPRASSSNTSALDPSLFPPLASSSTLPLPPPSPTLDLTYILTSLLRSSAFHLIPSQSFLHPPLPASSITDLNRERHQQSLLLLLGAEQEIQWIREGRIERIGGVKRGKDGGGDERERVNREEERKKRRLERWEGGDGGEDSGEGFSSVEEEDGEEEDDSDASADDFSDDDDAAHEGRPVGLHGTHNPTTRLQHSTSFTPSTSSHTPKPAREPWSTSLPSSSTAYLSARRTLAGPSSTSSNRDHIIRAAEDRTLANLRSATSSSSATPIMGVEDAVPGLMMGGTGGERLKLFGLVGGGGGEGVGGEKKGLREFEEQVRRIVKGD